eukprot:4836177-Prymnesium_polylepis.1
MAPEPTHLAALVIFMLVRLALRAPRTLPVPYLTCRSPRWLRRDTPSAHVEWDKSKIVKHQ